MSVKHDLRVLDGIGDFAEGGIFDPNFWCPALRRQSDLPAERLRTHGDFQRTAAIAQDLKNVLRSDVGWARLSPVQREALDAILTKIARILAGDAHFADHWEDVKGYAELALSEPGDI
jgi:hypothetical protein